MSEQYNNPDTLNEEPPRGTHSELAARADILLRINDPNSLIAAFYEAYYSFDSMNPEYFLGKQLESNTVLVDDLPGRWK